jgi:hypothetical protein
MGSVGDLIGALEALLVAHPADQGLRDQVRWLAGHRMSPALGRERQPAHRPHTSSSALMPRLCRHPVLAIRIVQAVGKTALVAGTV